MAGKQVQKNEEQNRKTGKKMEDLTFLRVKMVNNILLIADVARKEG